MKNQENSQVFVSKFTPAEEKSVFNQNYKKVISYLGKYRIQQVDAEEIASAVILKSYSHYDITKGVPIFNFLCQCAYRRLIDGTRKNKTRNEEFVSDYSGETFQFIDVPDTDVYEDERKLLYETIGSLKDNYKIIAIARYIEGKSYDEIVSGMTGMTETDKDSPLFATEINRLKVNLHRIKKEVERKLLYS